MAVKAGRLKKAKTDRKWFFTDIVETPVQGRDAHLISMVYLKVYSVRFVDQKKVCVVLDMNRLMYYYTDKNKAKWRKVWNR